MPCAFPQSFLPSVFSGLLGNSSVLVPFLLPGHRPWARWCWVLFLAGTVLLGACNHIAPAPLTAREGGQPRAIPAGAVPAGVTPVQLVKNAAGFRLLRGGQPYFLRGAGGVQHFAQLREAGGNTVRLWSTDYAEPLMDEAQRHGLTVMLGLWLEPESNYFNYQDDERVQEQMRRMREQVLRFRRHPALLMWNIGNEAELSVHGPRLFEAVNNLARMIHELDPYHPVTISLSDFNTWASRLQEVAPEVDILSVNAYGALFDLPARIRKSGWQGPYIVTEYGTRGYWEGRKTFWKAALEENSAEKSEFMRTRYQHSIVGDSSRCLGSYVFCWGYKFEYTATWFGLFEATGEKTEMVDELYRLWRNKYPPNRAPHLTDLRVTGLPGRFLPEFLPGQECPAAVTVTDPESDALDVRWEVLPDEVTVDGPIKERETPQEPVPDCVVGAHTKQVSVRMPATPGRYRLYVRVFDGHGSVATANVPLLVRVPKKHFYSFITTND